VADIKIQLNGETLEIPFGVSLDKLLDLFELPKQRVAFELNKSVVRRKDWPTTLLANGDKLEIVHFVGGG
jgi:sulfur carrier protein